MDQILDKFFETFEFNIQQEFSHYHVTVSQVRGSFYVLKRKPRGKILRETFKYMANDVKYISEKVYVKFSEQSNRFRYKYFPYVKLVRWCGGYQYHFVVVKQDYCICMEIDSTSCFYFCSHFDTGFKSKVNIKEVSILKKSNEVIGYCSDCKDKIRKFLEEI